MSLVSWASLLTVKWLVNHFFVVENFSSLVCKVSLVYLSSQMGLGASLFDLDFSSVVCDMDFSPHNRNICFEFILLLVAGSCIV